MSVKTPIRTVFDSDNNATGLAEFQSGEFIGLTHGGLGASLSIGSAGQILKVNSGGSALEFGNVEAVVNIDGATDLTSSTLVAGDQILLSDGGTEGRVTLSQIDTLFTSTTQSLTNKNLTAASNTFNPITIADDSSSTSTIGLGETLKVIGSGGITSSISADTLTIAIDGSIVTESSTDTLTNKTLTSPTITGSGAIAGIFTGNLTGDVTGNADTATTLETARDIGGVSFDGSANINLPGVNTSGNQDTSGNAATATTLETARTIAGQSFDGSSNITIASTDLSNTSDVVLLTSTQTLTNKTLTSPTITGTGAIAGTFTGNITGDVTGNADTATALETARTIAGQSFDGSANITIASTDLSDTADIALLDSTQTLTNKTLTSPTITGTGAIAGTFTGNITGDVTGNADTATTLATARTIAGQSFDGSANITIAATDLSDTDQSLSTTDNVTFNDMVVSGDLTVSGTTTTVNTETINLADNTITLNSNATGSATENGGIEIERGDDTNKTLL